MQDYHDQGTVHPGLAARIFSSSGRSHRPYSSSYASAGASHPLPAPVKCPRCDSTNTKFCYYNNYNLSQPRHFCKSCRRYWTKGGILRDVPVGGGTRKSKRSAASKVPADSSSSAPSSTTTPSADEDHPTPNYQRGLAVDQQQQPSRGVGTDVGIMASVAPELFSADQFCTAAAAGAHDMLLEYGGGQLDAGCGVASLIPAGGIDWGASAASVVVDPAALYLDISGDDQATAWGGPDLANYWSHTATSTATTTNSWAHNDNQPLSSSPPYHHHHHHHHHQQQQPQQLP